MGDLRIAFRRSPLTLIEPESLIPGGQQTGARHSLRTEFLSHKDFVEYAEQVQAKSGTSSNTIHA